MEECTFSIMFSAKVVCVEGLGAVDQNYKPVQAHTE